MLLVYLTSLFSELLTVGAQPQPCFLKCKDNYMHGMQQEMEDASTEWSVDMVTPLQALLTSKKRKGQLAYKLDRICKLNVLYQRCLMVCPTNPAKNILLNGQRAWNIICQDFRNDSDFRTGIIPCWAENGHHITERCHQLASFLQSEMVQTMELGLENIHEGLDNLCKRIHEYDQCFVTQNYEYCGSSAGRFLVKLTHQTSHALIELLDDIIGVNGLPKSCKEWLNQKGISSKSRAVQRHLRNRSRFNSYGLLSTFVLTLSMVIFTLGNAVL